MKKPPAASAVEGRASGAGAGERWSQGNVGTGAMDGARVAPTEGIEVDVLGFGNGAGAGSPDGAVTGAFAFPPGTLPGSAAPCKKK